MCSRRYPVLRKYFLMFFSQRGWNHQLRLCFAVGLESWTYLHFRHETVTRSLLEKFCMFCMAFKGELGNSLENLASNRVLPGPPRYEDDGKASETQMPSLEQTDVPLHSCGDSNNNNNNNTNTNSNSNSNSNNNNNTNSSGISSSKQQ